MSQVIIDNKLIFCKQEEEISEQFIIKLNENKIDLLDSDEFIRVEHPHCAFFKSNYQSEDIMLKRTTLYTPEGRLHSDFEQKEDGELIKVNYFAKKDKHLEILLIYIRDIEIVPINKTIDKEYKAIQMFNTPLNELLTLMDEDTLTKCIKKDEVNIIKALTQLGKIYDEKLRILKDNVSIEDKYMIFPQAKKLKLDYDFIKKWHLDYLETI